MSSQQIVVSKGGIQVIPSGPVGPPGPQGPAADFANLTSSDVVNAFSGTPDGTQFLKDDGTLSSPGALTHPDLAAHDSMGLATQAELDAINTALTAAINSKPGDAGEVVALFSGTPDGTKFLRDDGTLVTAGGVHPDLAAHDSMGLATQSELDAAVGDLDTFSSETLDVDGTTPGVLQVEAPTHVYPRVFIPSHKVARTVSTDAEVSLLQTALVLPDGIIEPSPGMSNAGGVVKFDIAGDVVNNVSASSDGATFRIKLGGTTILTLALTALPQAAQSYPFRLNGLWNPITFGAQASAGAASYIVGDPTTGVEEFSGVVKFGGGSLNLDGDIDITIQPTVNNANCGGAILSSEISIIRRTEAA